MYVPKTMFLLTLTLWHHMALYNWVIIGSGNGLFHAQSVFELVLTYSQLNSQKRILSAMGIGIFIDENPFQNDVYKMLIRVFMPKCIKGMVIQITVVFCGWNKSLMTHVPRVPDLPKSWNILTYRQGTQKAVPIIITRIICPIRTNYIHDHKPFIGTSSVPGRLRAGYHLARITLQLHKSVMETMGIT